jgi:hypothetical protein
MEGVLNTNKIHIETSLMEMLGAVPDVAFSTKAYHHQ